jgi:hypothetical protein
MLPPWLRWSAIHSAVLHTSDDVCNAPFFMYYSGNKATSAVRSRDKSHKTAIIYFSQSASQFWWRYLAGPLNPWDTVEKLSAFLWNLKVHNHVQKGSSLQPILIQMNPVILTPSCSRSILICATGWTIGVLEFDSRRRLGIFLFTTVSRTALGPTQPSI